MQILNLTETKTAAVQFIRDNPAIRDLAGEFDGGKFAAGRKDNKIWFLEYGTQNLEWFAVDAQDPASEIIFKGYTRIELETAFGLVENPADWKAPICAKIDRGNLARVMAAVEFYTSTQVRITGDVGGSIIRVEALGYRMGPAGDR